MWEQIVCIARDVPATFWGVLAGSFFTLIGVILTNRAHDRRQAGQLAHDREMRARDRDLALRKEIYLAATEAVQAGLLVVGRFADLNISDADLMKDFTAKSPAAAKVQLVASTETARAFNEVMAAINAAMMRLSIPKIALRGRQQRLSRVSEQMEQSKKDQDRWIEEMRQHNLSGNPDRSRLEMLHKNFTMAADEQEKSILPEHATLTSAIFRETLALAQSAVTELANLQEKVSPLVIAARRELQVETDEPALAAILQQANEVQRRAVEQFIKDVAKMERK